MVCFSRQANNNPGVSLDRRIMDPFEDAQIHCHGKRVAQADAQTNAEADNERDAAQS